MLEDIYIQDESLTEDEYYDALFYLLGDAYPDLSDEDIEDLLEDMLDALPEQYAEGVLDTIGNLGKKIGTGALQFTAQNPDLARAAGFTAGTLIGGPAGGAIGSSVGSYLTQAGQGQPAPIQAGPTQVLPQTGKTLALMQNPQAQAALARATMGVGNGTAPLVQNGNARLIPVATYLRAIIASAQQALRELDSQNIIPPATLSESLPYAEDVDMQAEWLAEQLTQ